MGLLNYLIIRTRPDFIFIVLILGSFNLNPGEKYLKLIK